jgi:hypothetical protein
MHYKGTGKVHSFRGLLPDGEQQKIRIEGSVGAIAWRITKFEVMTETPLTSSGEAMIKIYREKQDSLTNTVSFVDDELLGVALYIQNDNYQNTQTNVIFDNALFVRNIYVYNVSDAGSASCNYYIELEEVKVGKAGMAQLAVAAARRMID